MPDKTYNKCVINGTTYLDLSQDTVTADKLLEGYTAHDKNGAQITGTATTSTVLISDTTDSHGGTIRTITSQNTVTLQTKTITPTSSAQTVNPDTGYDGFSQVTVEAGGTTINNQNKTVTPSASQQSITYDSGYTGLGTVTVNGDSNLVSSNIVNGIQIFGVTGNVVLQNYYTGSSAPSSSTGSNGDLYLQT